MVASIRKTGRPLGGRFPSNSTVSSSQLEPADNQEDSNSNIRVVVRVRPPNERESTNANFRSIIDVVSTEALVFDPNEDNGDFYYHGCRQTNRDITKRVNKNMNFKFHRVFGENSTNDQVFKETTKDIVDSVLDGFNCSVFAYGATGAGKTHTMLGKHENPGITFLTLVELYRRMEDLKPTKRFEVAVSYIEVYNENVRDLLGNSGPLFIRDNGNDGITISGLTMPRPGSPQELLSLLEHGNKNRTQHPTDHNAESSRSHAVFQVWVKQTDRSAAGRNHVKMAKMSLIDLAGSERGSATGHVGERFREGNNINKSLLALGNCINALVEGRKHVPYRDSKLTRLLRDSLGGNCKTVMIAAISPSGTSFEDTYNTLKYAERAKKIKNTAKKNERSLQLAPWEYEQQIQQLRAELLVTKEKLRTAELSIQQRQEEPASGASAEIPAQILDIRQQLAALFHEEREIRHRLALLDAKERQEKQKILLKQQTLDRFAIISITKEKVEKVKQRLARDLANQKPKLEAIDVQKTELESRLSHNKTKKQQLQAILETSPLDSTLKELILDAVRMKELEVAVQTSQEVKIDLDKTLAAQNNERDRTEALLRRLLKTCRESHLLLKNTDYMSSYVMEEFQSLVTQVEGGRGVSWADETVAQSAENPSGALDATVVLSPLTENDQIRVPHTSVLLPSSNGGLLRKAAEIQTAAEAKGLDSTFTRLPDPEEQQRSLSETFVQVDVTEKENLPVVRCSPAVPGKTPLITTKPAAPPNKTQTNTHRLLRTGSFSRSTGDLSLAARNLHSKQNYMSATSSYKQKHSGLAPSAHPPAFSGGSGAKFKAPLSKLKKSISSLALTPTRQGVK